MAQLPLTIPPSSVNLDVYQPSGKSFSVSARSQAVSAGVHKWQIDFSYTLLDFDQRNEIKAFLASQKGRVGLFDVYVPTYSENSSVTAPTAAVNAGASAGSDTVTLKNISGELKFFNLINFPSHKKVYAVTTATSPVGGVQTLTINPPLEQAVNTNDVVNVKDVTIQCSLDSDTIGAKSQEMSASMGFSMVEDRE